MNRQEREQRNQVIIQMAKEGKTSEQIANYLSINRALVLSVLRSYNIRATRPDNMLKCEKAINIVTDLKAGVPQIEVARKYNVSRQYVNQINNKIKLLNS